MQIEVTLKVTIDVSDARNKFLEEGDAGEFRNLEEGIRSSLRASRVQVLDVRSTKGDVDTFTTNPRRVAHMENAVEAPYDADINPLGNRQSER